MLHRVLIAIVCTASVGTGPEQTPTSQSASPPASQPADAVPTRKVLAVLPAAYHGPEQELTALADSLGDLLSILLADNQEVTVVERVHLKKLLRESKLSLAGITGPPRAVEAGGLVKADFVVASTIEASEQGVTVRCHLIEVNGARIVHAVEKTGQRSELLATMQACAQGIAEGLDTKITDLHPRELDLTPRISLLYMRGLAFYHEGLPERAQVEFMRIIMLDPMHEHARAYNALAYHKAKDPEHARIAARWFLKNFPNSRYRPEIEALLNPDSQPSTRPTDAP